MVLWLALARGAYVCIEQPSSSLITRHPRWREFLSIIRLFEARFHMRDFGAPTAKLTTVWCSSRAFLPMVLKRRNKVKKGEKRRAVAVKTARVYVDKNGLRRCCGTKNLKPTQPDAQFLIEYAQCNAAKPMCARAESK